MKKYIVLSVNNNPDYSWYTPITAWTWKQFGWTPLIIFHNDDVPCDWKGIGKLQGQYMCDPDYKYLHVGKIPEFRGDTITQVSRLYAAGAKFIKPDDYLMLGDCDMFALSDAWKFNPDEITIWNWDLTDFTQIPMCFVGMTKSNWIQVMGITGNIDKMIERDLSDIPHAKKEAPWEKRWGVDQEILTERLKAVQFRKTWIHRGKLANGYARGRVDRGAWNLDHDEFIDCHALRDCYKLSDTGVGNLARTMRLLFKIWPNENFDWVRDYTIEFQKLANNG